MIGMSHFENAEAKEENVDAEKLTSEVKVLVRFYAFFYYPKWIRIVLVFQITCL